MIYLVLKHAHSIFRWLVLAGMVFIILRSALFLVKPWKEGTSGKKLVSLALSALHIQVLLGIILYFISPKVNFSAASMSNHLLRLFGRTYFLDDHCSCSDNFWHSVFQKNNYSK